MAKHRTLRLAVALIFGVGAGVVASRHVALADSREDAVLAALVRACDSFRDGDVNYLSRFLAADFTLTGSDGKVTTRADSLKEVREREPRYQVFRNHGMTVRFYGDTAVVNGITSIKGTSVGKAFTVDVQFTDTLIWKDGRWTLVASHASPLAN